MRKSFNKRIKVTRRGKLVRRRMGQGHFLAKRSTAQKGRAKPTRGLGMGKKILKKPL